MYHECEKYWALHISTFQPPSVLQVGIIRWLGSSERIDYKIAVLTYRVLHGGAPRYLGPLTSVVDLPSCRALRSAVTNRLVSPSVRLSTVGSRAFPVAAPRIWNSLPEHVVRAATLQSFKKHLKTFLLQRSYILTSTLVVLEVTSVTQATIKINWLIDWSEQGHGEVPRKI